MKIVKYLLASASMCLGLGAIAPAQAVMLTMDPNSIQFNSTNYQTYTGGSNGAFVPDNLGAARTALTDSDRTSNVELWVSSENPLANVGFSGLIGGHNISVSSVTASDWAVFGDSWINGLLAANPQMNVLWNNLGSTGQNLIRNGIKTIGLPAAGDPNIGSLTLDTDTNKLSMDLIGHLDLKPRILAGQYSFGNSLLDTFLKGAASQISGPIQASEVAKVILDNKTYYAYSFQATDSGIATSDGTESYTGIYNWDPGIPVTTAAVPEPSTMVGVALAGSFLAAKRKKSKQA